MSALSVFAAVVPIVGSLFVAGSFLVDQARAAHEYRARWRIAVLIEGKRAEIARLGLDGSARRDREEYLRDLERRLLAFNGVVTSEGSRRKLNIEAQMTAPVVPAREVGRQWVLLLSACAGLALLAVDAL